MNWGQSAQPSEKGTNEILVKKTLLFEASKLFTSEKDPDNQNIVQE